MIGHLKYLKSGLPIYSLEQIFSLKFAVMLAIGVWKCIFRNLPVLLLCIGTCAHNIFYCDVAVWFLRKLEKSPSCHRMSASHKSKAHSQIYLLYCEHSTRCDFKRITVSLWQTFIPIFRNLRANEWCHLNTEGTEKLRIREYMPMYTI